MLEDMTLTSSFVLKQLSLQLMPLDGSRQTVVQLVHVYPAQEVRIQPHHAKHGEAWPGS